VGQVLLLCFLVTFCSFTVFGRPLIAHLIAAIEDLWEILTQYWRFVSSLARAQLDSGGSWESGYSLGMLGETLLRSLILLGLSLSIGAAIGLPLGVISGRSRGALFTLLSSMLTLVGVVMPSFLLGLLVIVLLVRGVYVRFGVQLVSMDMTVDPLDARRLLPLAFVLGARPASYIARIVAVGVSEAYDEAYVYTARAKGLSERVVMWRHVFPNVTRSFITSLIASLRLCLSSTMVAEWLFNWPGIGRALLMAMRRGEADTVSLLLLCLALLLFLFEKAARLAILRLDPTSRGPEVPR